MPTIPGSIEALSLEQKANRELVATLLDAHFNLARSLTEAEAKLVARKDAAVKEFARANGVDAIIAVSKNVAVALDQLEKDITALKQSPRLVTDCLTRLEKTTPDIVKLALQERKAKDQKEIDSSTTGQLAFKEDLDFVNGELAKLRPAGAAGKKGAKMKGARKKKAAAMKAAPKKSAKAATSTAGPTP